MLAFSINGDAGTERKNILFELVKDIEPEVQNAALKSLARMKNAGFNYTLLDFISPERYNPSAIDIIANAGDIAIDYLEREQIVYGTSNIVLARIIKLYGRIGTSRAIENIISTIGNQDRYVLLHSLQALIDIKYQVNPKNKYKLLNMIVKQVGVITQNLHYYNILNKYR